MGILHSIELPQNSAVTRHFRKQIPPALLNDYRDGVLGAYDHRTIFYDLFLNPQAPEIIAMGPPLLNLETVLLPLKIWVNNEPCTYKQTIKHKQLAAFTIPVKHAQKPLCVRIEFHNGLTHEAVLDASPTLSPRGRALVAIQKNNQLEWIKDWISYYRQTWLVDYVCLYDNGSDNQQALMDALNSENVAVIPWNFPFGTYRFGANNFCQIGALNHFKQRFGQRCKIFNFDIDELLVSKDPTLQQRIDQEKLIRFDSYNVFHDPEVMEPYSFDDFTLRDKTPRDGAYKYIIDGTSTDIMQHHRTFPRARAVETLRKALPKKYRHGKVEPITSSYFMHYMAITTNWKAGSTKTKYRNSDAIATSEYVSDLSVANTFAAIRDNTTPTT